MIWGQIRTILLLLTAATTLISAMPRATAGPQRAVAHLARRNVAVGNGSAVTRVVLPEAVRQPRLTTVETTGRIAGVALVRIEAGRSVEERPGFYAFRFARCASLPCRDYRQFEVGYSRLPAGTYDLYLIADGASYARAEFAIKDLSGAFVVEPQRRSQTQVRSFSGLAENASFDGAETSLRGDGFAFYSFALNSADPHAATSFGHCIYRQGQDLPAAPYQPAHCPPIAGYGNTVVTNGDGLELTSYGFAPLLPRAIGLWHATAGPVENVSSLALWVAAR